MLRRHFIQPVYFRNKTLTCIKASHPNACYYTYHYLSCMFLLLKFYKNWTTKTIFDVAITTSISIKTIILPVVTTWYYQAHSHLMVYLPPKVILKSLSGHPTKVFLEKQRLYGKPRERWDLVHGRMVKKIVLEVFSKNDT